MTVKTMRYSPNLLLLCATLLLPVAANAVPKTALNPVEPDTVAVAIPAIPAPEKVLTTLRSGHPRLLATREDFATLGKQVGENAELSRWLDLLRQEAETPLPPLFGMKGNGNPSFVLLSSTALQHRAMLFGLFFQLTGDKKYAARLWPDLEYAIQAEKWRPEHFLTTAEVTSAMGIAYDWLYDAWTPDQRA